MKRLLLVVTILASFNCIALLLHMSGRMAMYLPMLSSQEILWVVVAFLVLVDVLILYLLVFSTSGGYYGDFERVFRKYYDGSNYEEAFRKARREYLHR